LPPPGYPLPVHAPPRGNPPPPAYPTPGYPAPGHPSVGYAPPGYAPLRGNPPPPSYPADGSYGYPGLQPPLGMPGRPASMGARFGGLLIDTLVVSVLSVAIDAPLGLISRRSTQCDLQGHCSGFFLVVSWPGVLIALALGVVYSAIFVGLTTQTLGHRVAGIKVVNAATGARIGPGYAALRWLVMVLGGAIFTIGYWSPFFDDQRRRGWHDQASRSIAIAAR
jgi:uncharacterized RDD family membrane protein YckC